MVFGQGLPNLKPHQLFGWPDTLVVHTNAGQAVDTAVVHESQDVYVDWAVFNDSLHAATNRFFISVFVDNNLRANWFSVGLAPQLPTWVSDGMIGKLEPGFRTIRLEIDSTGVIEESDETDNVVEQSVIVTTTNVIAARIFDARVTPEGAFAFNFLGSIGRRYDVEYSSGVDDWLPMETLTNVTGVATCIYPIAGNEQRSYRVRLLSP